jgi:PhzF family phenazine biosynthesis protein
MPLCGHATLAAAKIFFERYGLSEISFLYQQGKINIYLDNEGYINMIFPIDEYKEIEIDSIYTDFFGKQLFTNCIYGINTKKVVLILDKNIDIKQIKPNFNSMQNNTGIYINGIGLSKESNKYDIETRYFNPWAGVNEDPVTGSVHTVLAKYWSDYYKKDEIVSYQNSQRPGIIKLKIIENNKVEIKGKAKIIMTGKIII